MAKAKAGATLPEIQKVLEQDTADVKLHKVKGTPSFFVNGSPLIEFSPEGLLALVTWEVEKARSGVAN